MRASSAPQVVDGERGAASTGRWGGLAHAQPENAIDSACATTSAGVGGLQEHVHRSIGVAGHTGGIERREQRGRLRRQRPPSEIARLERDGVAVHVGDHGDTPLRHSRRSAPRAVERVELAPVPLELLALRLDDRRPARSRRNARSRASPPRGRSPCAGARARRPRRPSPSAAPDGRPRRRCAARPPSRARPARRCAGTSPPPPGRARARRRRPRVRRPGSGHGRDDQARALAGRCDQISSVTCGITGCSSASSRSSAASAVATRGPRARRGAASPPRRTSRRSRRT